MDLNVARDQANHSSCTPIVGITAMLFLRSIFGENMAASIAKIIDVDISVKHMTPIENRETW